MEPAAREVDRCDDESFSCASLERATATRSRCHDNYILIQTILLLILGNAAWGRSRALSVVAWAEGGGRNTPIANNKRERGQRS